MTRRKAPAPAGPAKKAKGGHGLLRVVLAVVVLGGFALFVLPSPSFGRWIAEPRNLAALAGGAVAFVVLYLVALRLKVTSDSAVYAVVALALLAGGLLYVQDAGSAAVKYGVMDCPKPAKGTARVASPSGRQCVEVKACPRGTVPGWKADKVTPTGKCVKPRRRG